MVTSSRKPKKGIGEMGGKEKEGGGGGGESIEWPRVRSKRHTQGKKRRRRRDQFKASVFSDEFFKQSLVKEFRSKGKLTRKPAFSSSFPLVILPFVYCAPYSIDKKTVADLGFYWKANVCPGRGRSSLMEDGKKSQSIGI